jgi:hypothetical protein
MLESTLEGTITKLHSRLENAFARTATLADRLDGIDAQLADAPKSFADAEMRLQTNLHDCIDRVTKLESSVADNSLVIRTMALEAGLDDLRTRFARFEEASATLALENIISKLQSELKDFAARVGADKRSEMINLQTWTGASQRFKSSLKVFETSIHQIRSKTWICVCLPKLLGIGKNTRMQLSPSSPA